MRTRHFITKIFIFLLILCLACFLFLNALALFASTECEETNPKIFIAITFISIEVFTIYLLVILFIERTKQKYGIIDYKKKIYSRGKFIFHTKLTIAAMKLIQLFGILMIILSIISIIMIYEHKFILVIVYSIVLVGGAFIYIKILQSRLIKITSKYYLTNRQKVSSLTTWQQIIKYRDGYQCQLCGERALKLQAHHVIPRSHDISLQFELHNGVTLCKNCHKFAHRYINIFQKVVNNITPKEEPKQ